MGVPLPLKADSGVKHSLPYIAQSAGRVQALAGDTAGFLISSRTNRLQQNLAKLPAVGGNRAGLGLGAFATDEFASGEIVLETERAIQLGGAQSDHVSVDAEMMADVLAPSGKNRVPM